MKVPEQVQRLAVVVGFILVVVLLLRFVVIPSSYFSVAAHEQSTVARVLALPISFAGSAACGECHEDVVDTKAKSFHRGVACETCHGPSVKHTEDPLNLKPDAPRDRKFCPVCHAYDPARPTGFPQINPMTHNPLKPCISCHSPHDPTPPETPRECSACHAQIEHTKSLSSHALLPCTTCHTASDAHRANPRTSLPTKPTSREFCGGCHGKDATEPNAPRIDLATHNQPYLCWQCHYPHLPEAR